MPAAQLLAFLLAAVFLAVTPGPDIVSVISYGLSRGRRAGILFGAGCALGCLLHTLWLTIGLSAVIAASVTAFAVLKIAGASYLFYLAWRAFRSGGTIELKEMADATTCGWIFFRRGFIANVLNPKVVLFFIAFLPAFTGPGGFSLQLQFLLLGTLFALVSLAVFSIAGVFSGTVGHYLRAHAHAGKWLDRLAGTVFVMLGLRILFAQARADT